MKRFYEAVEIKDFDQSCQVLLDGKPLRTPRKLVLEVQSRRLAKLVAGEWQAQDKQINPASMPITKLVTTTLDLMPERREPALREIADFAVTDMLCYRASDPSELAERQTELWQPWLDWANTALDAPLAVTTSFQAVDQPLASLQAIKRHIESLDHWRLVAVHAATQLTSSSILAIAMQEGVLKSDEALNLALLEEMFEIERFGLEDEQGKRHQALKRDLVAVEAFLEALLPAGH